jgi:hypothetical protein
MMPDPIAAFGSLQAGQSSAFSAVALAGSRCVAGANINLNLSGGPGSVAVPPNACGGANRLGGTAIACTTDSTGSVAMIFAAPSPLPDGGTVEVNAQAGSVTGHDWYLFEYVYRFSASPIAAGGSLAPDQQVPLTLRENGVDGTPTSSAAVYLALKSSASPGGSVLVQGVQLSSSPRAFALDSSGQIQLTYTAPSSPPSTGIDTIMAGSSTSSVPAVNSSTSYAFGSGYPTLSVGDIAQVEGDAQPHILAEFNVTLSAPQSTAVTVQYTTVCGVGDKSCGEDYLQTLPKAPRSITIPAGQVRGQINVRVYSYSAFEPYVETFFVQLANPVGAILGRSLGQGTIINDDETTTAEILYIGDVGVVRGTSGNQLAEFTVTLSSPSSGPVNFQYATQDGTAKSGIDYFAASGTATIAPGATSTHIQVPILGGSTSATPITFTATLGNASGATIERSSGTGTII